MNPIKEITDKRPTNYSRWHRPPNLPEWCCLTDGDWFEQRKCEEELRTVAYMETLEVPPLFIESAQRDYELWASKQALLKEISLNMKVPCFVVRHVPNCDLFSVARFTAGGEAEAVIMSEEQYKSFILELRPTHPCTNCGSTAWWWRQNNWATKGEWLCGRCHPNPNKEAEMPTDKGHCPHGEFILLEGCPQCIEEARQAREAAKAAETVDRDTESLAENQQGQLELATDEISLQEEPAPELIGTQLAEEAGIVEADDESYRAPYNASYHAPYRLTDGSIAPGVTTVLGILEKPGLHYWIADTTKAGEDWVEVRDAAGRVGTFTHQLIACHLQGEAVDSPFLMCSQEEREKASRCFAKYLAWEKKNPLTPVMIEERLVSELFKFGGTPDLLAELNGKFVLIDFKTSGRIYDDYFCQVAAYRKLLEEQGWPVTKAWILRISPNDDQYEVGIQLDFDRDWQIFQHALAIYRLQGEKRQALAW